MPLCNLRDRFDVGQLQRWIAGSLDEDHAGCGSDCGFDVVGIGSVHKRRSNSQMVENLAKQAHGSAIYHIGEDRVISGFQHRKQECCDCGHACAETDSRGCPFQRANCLFQRVYGWVGNPRVTEPFIDSDCIVNEGAGLIERKENRTGVTIQ